MANNKTVHGELFSAGLFLDFHLSRLWSEYVELIFNIAAIIIGIPANSWSIYRYWKLWRAGKSNRRCLLGMNLTVSNLLMIIFHCGSKVVVLINLVWPWGSLLCKIRSFTSAFVHYLSSNSIVVIAFEVFYTLHRPLEARTVKGYRRAFMQIFLSILLSTLCSFPQLWTWGVVNIPPNKNQSAFNVSMEMHAQCIFVYSGDFNFTAFYELCHVITVFYIPLLLIVACYVACCLVVKKKLKRRERLQEFSKTSVLSLTAELVSLDQNSRDASFRKRGRSTGSPKVSKRGWPKWAATEASFRKRGYSTGTCKEAGYRRGGFSTDCRSNLLRKTLQNRPSLEMANKKVKKKLFRVSMTVILVYIIFWLPYQTISLASICLDIQWKHKPEWFQYAYWTEALLLSTMLINPVLYTYHGF